MAGYKIRVNLNGLPHKVERELTVPCGINFEVFQLSLNSALGWKNCHLHQFIFSKPKFIITNDEEAVEEYLFYSSDEGKKHLATTLLEHRQYLPDMTAKLLFSKDTTIDIYINNEKKFTYEYDFGDGWNASIELVGFNMDYDKSYAEVTNFVGNCPPEDVGGVPGYEEFLETINGEECKEKTSRLNWAKRQGYGEYDKEKANAKLKSYKRYLSK